MNDRSTPAAAGEEIDPKVQRDWDDVEARRAEINSREGGDTRRRAILRRLGLDDRAS
jgi:hypothetical protein